MAKWHNGPKGPGVCRATKGNCPFGGEESHFKTKTEAQEQYNKQSEAEYGLLPRTETPKKVSSILASNSASIPVSLGNFARTRKGSSADEEHISSKLKDTSKTPEEIVEDLNKDPQVIYNFKLHEKTEDGYKLKTDDNQVVNVLYENKTKEKPSKKKVSKEISAFAKNSAGLPVSNANFVSTGKGTKADEEYFLSKFQDSSMSSKDIEKSLNEDKNILETFKVVAKTANAVHLRTVGDNPKTIKVELKN